MRVGIECINAYCGQAALDIRQLFEARGLGLERFENLMMQQKSVGLPCEDPITNAVNAAKPIINNLTQTEKDQIELVITASESGLDFGKSLSTYIHAALGLNKRCRLFEVKQACYGGTAALQMAASYILSQGTPYSKALVIATDVARAAVKMTYAEPSQGVAAIAMLISGKPDILELDIGASGCYSYEVMDTCRPTSEIETGDPDLSLLSYLDCLEGSYQAYQEKVENVDLQKTFQHLIFHTPFAGMVKGAHRKLMRKFKSMAAPEIDSDFTYRVSPSLDYCKRVGNVYSASVYLALCGLIDGIELQEPKRVGIYSYGSGCSSEFFSGVLKPLAKKKLNDMEIGKSINQRYPLSLSEYDSLLNINAEWTFGIKDKQVDVTEFQSIYDQQLAGKGLLILQGVENYHRKYLWS